MPLLPKDFKGSSQFPILLYCGVGEWRVGVFDEGGWRDCAHRDEPLQASYFALLPEEPG